MKGLVPIKIIVGGYALTVPPRGLLESYCREVLEDFRCEVGVIINFQLTRHMFSSRMALPT